MWYVSESRSIPHNSVYMYLCSNWKDMFLKWLILDGFTLNILWLKYSNAVTLNPSIQLLEPCNGLLRKVPKVIGKTFVKLSHTHA